MKFNKVALSIACAAGFTVAGAAAANADTVTVKSGDTCISSMPMRIIRLFLQFNH